MRLFLRLASALCQKFAREIGGLSSIMPAKAGIQRGTGYFFGFQKVACPLSGSWIPGRASYRQLARNDD